MQLMGLLIIIRTFFALPVELIKEVMYELDELGKRGNIKRESTDFPFLTLYAIVGRLIIVIVYFIIIGVGIFGLLSGFVGAMKVRGFGSSYQGAILFGAIMSPLVAFLVATAVAWCMSITLELFLLLLNIADNTKRMAENMPPVMPASSFKPTTPTYPKPSPSPPPPSRPSSPAPYIPHVPTPSAPPNVPPSAPPAEPQYNAPQKPYCPYCNKEVGYDDMFCVYCGKEL